MILTTRLLSPEVAILFDHLLKKIYITSRPFRSHHEFQECNQETFPTPTLEDPFHPNRIKFLAIAPLNFPCSLLCN